MQRLKDIWFVRWNLRQMRCALRGHLDGLLTEYPKTANMVLICKHCGGCANRPAVSEFANEAESHK